MLDEAGGVVWPSSCLRWPMAGRGGPTAEANTEGDPSRQDRKGLVGLGEPPSGQRRQAERRDRRF